MGTKVRVNVMALFLALVVVFGFGSVASAALSAVSTTVDPVNGYPVWYQDDTGLQLNLCFDAANCFFDPVDPLNPDSVALGVGGETFYWLSEALIPMAAGNQALLVMAMEAAFGGPLGEPALGEQVTFSRLRIRIDAPVAGPYTVTHPFGVENFNVVAPGPSAINFTSDIGGFVLPSNFAVALAGDIGPFLRWDPTVLPAAPAGFLGNLNIEHPVIGSPLGTNFFRVDGPAGSNLDGLGNDFVETVNFATMGQIYAAFPPSATITRDTLGVGSVTVRFSGPAGSTVNVTGDGGVLLPGEPAGGFLLTESIAEPGVYDMIIPIPGVDVLPATVTFTSVLGANVRSAPGVLVTDLVVITSADFNTNTLTVVADSANDFAVPLAVLTVTTPAAVVLGTIDTAISNTLSVGTPMPAEVIVTSTGGGVVRATVTDLTPGAADPGAGVPGGGGGGGGGCFIGSLIN